MLEDLRGSTDHDGRPLAVTMRAVADEVAAAADLVKGKADGIPAALVRGLDAAWFSPDAAGARALVRVGPGDWFALGHVEALRAALGVRGRERAVAGGRHPSGAARRAAGAERWAGSWRSPCSTCPRARPTSASTRQSGSAEVTLGAPDGYDLGRLVVRAEVAAASEGLGTRQVRRTGTARHPGLRLRGRPLAGNGRPPSPEGSVPDAGRQRRDCS